MSNKNTGCQTIGCGVNSCRHHCANEDACELNTIRVEPMSGCHTGEACDESMCGNYSSK